MTEERKEILLHMKLKNYATDEEKPILWEEYEKVFGPWYGSRDCLDCIRDAIKNLYVHIISNEL